MIKLFFLAAASAMFMVYNVLQTQVRYRTPSSTTPTVNIPNVYSYQDMITTFETAVVNENVLKQNVEQLQNMLATEKQRYSAAFNERRQTHAMMTMASPYNPISKNITQIETDLKRLRMMRQNNIDTAYMRLFFTYSSIQMPPRDGRPGLSEEQHKDARAKMDYIIALKQAIQCEGTGFCNYPTLQQPYVTANLYTPPLLNPPAVPATAPEVTPAPAPVAVTPAPQAEAQVVFAPQPEGTIEAVPEVAQ